MAVLSEGSFKEFPCPTINQSESRNLSRLNMMWGTFLTILHYPRDNTTQDAFSVVLKCHIEIPVYGSR